MIKSVIFKVNLGFYRVTLAKDYYHISNSAFKESFEEKDTFVKEFYSTTGFVQVYS